MSKKKNDVNFHKFQGTVVNRVLPSYASTVPLNLKSSSHSPRRLKNFDAEYIFDILLNLQLVCKLKSFNLKVYTVDIELSHKTTKNSSTQIFQDYRFDFCVFYFCDIHKILELQDLTNDKFAMLHLF